MLAPQRQAEPGAHPCARIEAVGDGCEAEEPRAFLGFVAEGLEELGNLLVDAAEDAAGQPFGHFVPGPVGAQPAALCDQAGMLPVRSK